MAYKLVLTMRAARDLRDIAVVLRSANLTAVEATLSAIVAALQNLTEHPFLGRQSLNGRNRRLPIGSPVYVAVYRIVKDEVIVLHVRDGRRKPVRM